MQEILNIIDSIPSFIFTWTTFFGAGMLFLLLKVQKRLGNLSFHEAFKIVVPFDPLRSKSFHIDLKIYIIRKLSDFVFLIPGTYLLFLISNGTYDILSVTAGSHFSPVKSSALVFGVACASILALEFNAFLWHYIEHKVPFLWELHKVHHSADNLNPLTNKRAHSFVQVGKFSMNGLISGVPAGLIMHYYGFSFVELIAISAISNKLLTVVTLDALRHSHVPMRFGGLEWVIVSPHMHQIHHSSLEEHWDKNFGTNLAIFDWMFGTGYRPRKGEEVVHGIYGYSLEQIQQFNTLRGTYWDPLVRSVESLKRSLRPASEF